MTNTHNSKRATLVAVAEEVVRMEERGVLVSVQAQAERARPFTQRDLDEEKQAAQALASKRLAAVYWGDDADLEAPLPIFATLHVVDSESRTRPTPTVRFTVTREVVDDAEFVCVYHGELGETAARHFGSMADAMRWVVEAG